jgi:RNA polymerase sigma-54 factor
MLQMNKLELSELVSEQLSQNPVLEEMAPEEISIHPDLANIDFTETRIPSFDGAGEGGGGLAADQPLVNGLEHLQLSDLRAFGSGEGADGRDRFIDGIDAVGAATGSTDAASDLFTRTDGRLDSTGDPLLPPPGDAAELREPEIGERDSFEEIDFGTTFEEYLDPGYRTRETEVKESPSFEQFLSSEQSLADYLNWQLRLTITSPQVREAAEAIIGNLNDDGFLEGTTLEEVAALGPWSKDLVLDALHIVQQLDPTGIGARNLQECLILQLEAHGMGDRLAARLIRDYFPKLINHKLPEVARELSIPVELLLDELKVIRSLDPHPGRKFASRQAHYIEPEVHIEKIDDDYLIRFNDDGLPQLRINRQYRQMMESKESSKETRDYIKDRFRSAVDLLKNIEHRKQTIYKVCERIVERQRDFLDYGTEHIKPMMLKDISEDIGMHLSTISRVVNGKYAHTPQGVIELRRFFTEGMTNDDGEEVSTRIIKLKIKKMIEAEDGRHPLTDDQIADRLAGEGQKLSRRTVAKYRDQMNISGSRERRQVV